MFRVFLRRHPLASLLFTLCLSGVLLSGEAPFLQSVGAAPTPRPSPSMVVPIAATQTATQTVRKTVLSNGLTVLTKEVPTAPVVTAQVWYRIGSRDEAPGVNGIAHQLEHLLFKGTKQRPIQFGRLFSALGSQSNAFTSHDQTAYFGTVERDKLRSLLTLEADRMQNSVIAPEQLKSENRVVISELQGYENNPSYRLNRAVMRAALPDSPYGLPVGGTKADVEKFTVEQVRQYYRNYYSPQNATVILVGDFKTDPTLKMVQELFGAIPNQSQLQPSQAAKPASPVAPRSLSNTANSAPPKAPPKKPIVLREPGSAPLLQAVYPLPPATHPDVPAIQVLDLVLTEGRSSRFYQALVESGLVSDFSGSPATMISGGWYGLSATAAPGQDLNKIHQTIQQLLAQVRSQPVSAEELQRAKTQLKSSILLRNRDITNQAFQLGDDHTTTGDYQFTDRLLAAVDRVTAADLQRVANTYFDPKSLTLGYFEPIEIKATAGKGGDSSQTSEKFNLGAPVDPAEVAKYLPAATPSRNAPNGADRPSQTLPQSFTLANGLKILLLKDTSTPTVTLNAHIMAGAEFDTPAQSGLAKLTADNLTNGTASKDALTLAKVIADRGINFNISANRESILVSANLLSEHLPVLVDTMADVVQNATFPEQELALSRQRALTALKVQMDTPAYRARRVFQQTIYPENHPFHSFPTAASLQSLQRQDLLTFYKTHYRPDSTVVALVGNFDPAQVKQLFQRALGNWQAIGDRPQLQMPPVKPPKTLTRRYIGIPGKTQAISFIGSPGINRQDTRFYQATVMNQILGGDTLSSRLGTEIRDRQGLTYGINSQFQAGNHPGPFAISMQTAPEDTEAAVTRTLRLLGQMRAAGVSPREVATAQRSLTSSYAVELANPDQLVSEILLNEVYGLKPQELRQYPQQLAGVTPKQVNRSAEEFLTPEQMVVVTAGPPRSEAQKK